MVHPTAPVGDSAARAELCAIPPRFTPLPLGAIKAQGWLLERLRRDAVGLVGRLDDLCDEVTLDVFGPGRVDSERPGAWWNGESTGNWLDGLVRLTHVLPAGLVPEIAEKTERYIDRLLATQDSDGYLGVYGPDLRWRTTGASGEFFCQSRLLSILLAHHEATGREDVRSAAVRAAELIVHNCDPGAAGHYFSSDGAGKVDGGRAHGLLIVEQMLAIAELTRDRRFVDFAASCYEDYSFSGIESPVEWCYADCKLPHLLDEDRPFIGHGPHTMEHLRIPLLLHHWTGDERYLAAHLAGHRKLARCIGLSGGCKADEWIGMRALGGVAVPPIPEAGYEYCALTELTLTLGTAVAWTGEGQFADMAELLVFNAAEAARQPDGRSIAYVAADNQYHAAAAAGGRWKYSPVHADVAVCCAPNAGRLLPAHVSRLVMRSDDGGIAVVSYGPCAVTVPVDGGEVRLVQTTAYPYGDDVRVTLDIPAPQRFPLWLRMPEWAEEVQLLVGSEPVASDGRGNFRRIDRLWHPGDTVSIRFESAVKPVRAVDATVAVRRGPLVFALPIDGVAVETKPYGDTGFHDLDVEPTPAARWNYTLLLGPDGGCEHAKVVTTDSDDPLTQPPIAIEVPALDSPGHRDFGTTVTRLRLLPVAATTLRRTSFPAVVTSAPEALTADATPATSSGLGGT